MHSAGLHQRHFIASAFAYRGLRAGAAVGPHHIGAESARIPESGRIVPQILYRPGPYVSLHAARVVQGETSQYVAVAPYTKYRDAGLAAFPFFV